MANVGNTGIRAPIVPKKEMEMDPIVQVDENLEIIIRSFLVTVGIAASRATKRKIVGNSMKSQKSQPMFMKRTIRKGHWKAMWH